MIEGLFTYFYNRTYTIILGTGTVPKTNIMSSNPTNITFIAPSVNLAQIVQVYIIFDGITYTNETVLFSYKTYSNLTAIYPTSGPTEGGTMIRVWGSAFDDQAYCYLDGDIILPIRVNSTFMVCETHPRKAGGNLTFQLTFNSNSFTTSSNITFTYYNDVQMNAMSPEYVSIYAGTNNVTVDLYGLGFINSSLLSVRVDNQIIYNVTYISSKHL